MLKQIAQAVGSLSLHPLRLLSAPDPYTLAHPMDLSFLFSSHGAISSDAVLYILGSGMKCVCACQKANLTGFLWLCFLTSNSWI